jgi:hypothetical protein
VACTIRTLEVRLTRKAGGSGHSSAPSCCTGGATTPPYLIAHVQQCAQGQPECEALVVADKVAHVLQEEVARAVHVTVRQVAHHHAVLDHAPVALVEPAADTRNCTCS